MRKEIYKIIKEKLHFEDDGFGTVDIDDVADLMVEYAQKKGQLEPDASPPSDSTAITESDKRKFAMSVVNYVCKTANLDVDVRQAINDMCDEFVLMKLNEILSRCDFIKQVIKERHWWRELAIEKSKSRDYETAFKATITADAMDKIIELYNETEAS